MAKSPPNRTPLIIFIVLLVLAAAGFATWWFVFRQTDESIVTPGPVADVRLAYIGKKYGNSDLSIIYSILDATNVRVLKVGEPCRDDQWRLLPSGTSMMIGSDIFTIGSSSIMSSTETFEELEGSIDEYCKLIGTSV